MALTRASGKLYRMQVEETNRPNLAGYLGDVTAPAPDSGGGFIDKPTVIVAALTAVGYVIGGRQHPWLGAGLGLAVGTMWFMQHLFEPRGQ